VDLGAHPISPGDSPRAQGLQDQKGEGGRETQSSELLKKLERQESVEAQSTGFQ
jgi:hypothetical protein